MNCEYFEIEDGIQKKYHGSNIDVMIPNGVKEIGDSAFRACSNLVSLTIPIGVTKIGVGAFRGCSNLRSIELPHGVTDI